MGRSTPLTKEVERMVGRESPDYVKISFAAAITLGVSPGKFFRGAKLYCLNLLLTYEDGCIGKCAYCGLSNARKLRSLNERSFIRVDWPTVPLSEVLKRMESERCAHVRRVCVSMITNRRAREDTLTVVRRLKEKTNAISSLVAPTVINEGWLGDLKEAGADKVGVAVDAATPELFDKLRGRGVRGPHKWSWYWKIVEDAVEVFGEYNVGVHLIVGLGETEREMAEAIQKAYDTGALTHIFSFFPEEGSQLESRPQPPIGQWRRVQLARYLINKAISSYNRMRFDCEGRIVDFGISKEVYGAIVESGLPFMTAGCSGKGMENACNRPFSNCTPYQAYIGEMRNFPFKPNKRDIVLIKKQIKDYSNGWTAN